jgi:hypothetical protein
LYRYLFHESVFSNIRFVFGNYVYSLRFKGKQPASAPCLHFKGKIFRDLWDYGDCLSQLVLVYFNEDYLASAFIMRVLSAFVITKNTTENGCLPAGRARAFFSLIFLKRSGSYIYFYFNTFGGLVMLMLKAGKGVVSMERGLERLMY